MLLPFDMLLDNDPGGGCGHSDAVLMDCQQLKGTATCMRAGVEAERMVGV